MNTDDLDSNQSWHSTLAAIAEHLLKLRLSMNPQITSRLSELDGLVIGLEIIDFEVQLFFLPDKEKIKVVSEKERNVDTWIRSTALNLFKASKANPGDGVKLEVSGDISAGQSFQRLLQDTDFDWEELLAPWIGDIATHHLGRSIKHARHWLHRSLDSIAFSSAEYIREEAKVVASSHHIHSFIREVDRLRDDVDRLEFRIRRLCSRT